MLKRANILRVMASTFIFVSLAVGGFFAGAIYIANPNQTALATLTWDGVAAGMTLIGALATFVACGLALHIAGNERDEREAKDAGKTRVFATLVRNEFSDLLRRVTEARMRVRRHVGGHPDQVAMWPEIVKCTRDLELPVSERLLEHALELDPEAVKPILDTIASIQHFKAFMGEHIYLTAPSHAQVQKVYTGAHMLLINLQLMVNESHEQIWNLSGIPFGTTAIRQREVDMTDFAQYEAYVAQTGIIIGGVRGEYGVLTAKVIGTKPI